jgi:hypothetical protein
MLTFFGKIVCDHNALKMKKEKKNGLHTFFL